MNGMQFMQALLERKILVPVIVLSATDSMQAVSDAVDSGASGFISKSQDSEYILSAIRSVLAGERFIPDEIKKKLITFNREKQAHQDKSKASDFGITRRQLKALELLVEDEHPH